MLCADLYGRTDVCVLPELRSGYERGDNMTKEEAIKLIDDRMCFGRGKWSEHHRPVIDEYWQAGEMAIKALEAEPQWIPVTERLPKESGLYQVTDIQGNVVRYVFNANEGSVEYWRRCVKAWMPLPESYRGE